MHRLAIAALSCALPLCLSSCADDEVEEAAIPIDKTGAMVPLKLIGRVASIPADRKFILIQSYGLWQISSGSILITQGADNRTANLLVTGEASGQYAAADIQSGTIEVGDGVYSRETPSVKPAPAVAPELIDSHRTRPF